MSEFERLTSKSEVFDGVTLKGLCESCGESGCNEFCEDLQDKECKGCPVQESFHRLSAYENSGLSPSEVADLAKAKAEGRLIELPCSVGESYYGVCQEVHHVKGKWKTERWVETGEVLGFNIVAELSTTEAEVKQHQRNIDEHSEYWFTGENAKDEAEAILKKLETGGGSNAV